MPSFSARVRLEYPAINQNSWPSFQLDRPPSSGGDWPGGLYSTISDPIDRLVSMNDDTAVIRQDVDCVPHAWTPPRSAEIQDPMLFGKPHDGDVRMIEQHSET